MTPCIPMRGFSFKRGISLIELFITLSLIGIVVAALIPQLFQAREEALRQTARQQAKVMEKAVANWYAAQPSLATASAAWNSNCANPANPSGYITSGSIFNTSHLGPYLPDSGAIFTIDANGLIDTPEMQQLPVYAAANPLFIGGSIDANDDAKGHAHLRLYWDPANRKTTSPKVYFFLPNLP